MIPKVDEIEDVQGQADGRGLRIEQVGISEVKMPMVVQDRERGRQQVTATIRISASLSSSERGTHMSRFVELLDRFKSRPLNPELLEVLLEAVVDRLDADRSYLDVSFLYFRTKRSPLTKEPALMGYSCHLGGGCEKNGGASALGASVAPAPSLAPATLPPSGRSETLSRPMSETSALGASETLSRKFRKIVEVEVPILTLCPCSKAISEFGAHNQRTMVKAAVEMAESIWIEELIDLVETEGSCQIYPLLKRPDEKYVTEASYRNPKFVEDVVRDIALKFESDARVASYRIDCESLESIHAHNAYAIITSGSFPSSWR